MLCARLALGSKIQRLNEDAVVIFMNEGPLMLGGVHNGYHVLKLDWWTQRALKVHILTCTALLFFSVCTVSCVNV